MTKPVESISDIAEAVRQLECLRIARDQARAGLMAAWELSTPDFERTKREFARCNGAVKGLEQMIANWKEPVA